MFGEGGDGRDLECPQERWWGRPLHWARKGCSLGSRMTVAGDACLAAAGGGFPSTWSLQPSPCLSRATWSVS